MSVETTSAVLPQSAAAFTAPTPGSLPAAYVETDPAQCSQAKIAHLLGLFGIVGTGVFYLIKKDEAGTFAKDQMKEAFNFQLLVFVAAIAVSIVGAIAAVVLGKLAIIFSLVSLAIMIGAIVLLVTNAMKAGKGQVARYPARLSVLK